jgi:hypothetical protein
VQVLLPFSLEFNRMANPVGVILARIGSDGAQRLLDMRKSEAQRAAECGSKQMRNFLIRRAEQAPFCAMFLRSTRTTRAGLLEGGRNLVSEGEHCDASQDGLGSYSREMNGAFMPD